MAEPLRVNQVFDALRQYAHKYPDIGVGKAILDGILEPASPFDRKGTRSPKRWFVLFALLAVVMLGCFIYFNRLP
jgi:hypothetical protein